MPANWLFFRVTQRFLMGHWCLFCSDWREAFLISWSYGMGDPMAPSECAGNSEGEGHEQAGRLAAPGGLGTKEKIPIVH
jgi:hypothetical protein